MGAGAGGPEPEAPQLSDAQRFDWLRLLRSESIGPRTFQALINRFGSARAALDALPGLAPRGRPVRLASEAEIDREFEAAAKCGARFVAIGEADYPALLRRIDSAPPLIALRGDAAIFNRPAVAIVGARNASGAGLAFAERLARGLAQAGFVVISGLARGIDIRAHQTTMETGTVAVLAGGHDRIYPAEHAPALERLIAHGAALSEMPFGWEARGRDFPRRNRLVAGLAQGTVVVEAARRSGSLITARFAAEQGRDVFAVPGSPLDPRAEGTNDLLRDGATICTSAQDVIDALARQIERPMQKDLFSESAPSDAPDEHLWDELDLPEVEAAPKATAAEHERGEGGRSGPIGFAPLRDEAATPVDPAEMRSRIIALLGPSPISIDELARAAEAPAGEVRAILLELELAGQLERQDGGLVSRL
ncbi:DNA-processing protein DprA [Methylovirgula sp. HY1]|uniref:DNA-processing protein DprA n=1 Tax=Methylovirgula sp. HY1 TaxID=2822761 RepID=UPI001C5B3529|nr:DNA-processing protein DprA [Methylovirgula sp. HY1]QXX74144.1 DNA processing protein DprA [Methylovirgula sp. HY1]